MKPGRQAKLLTYKGESLSVTEWAKKIGTYPQIFRYRLKTGHSLADMIEGKVVDMEAADMVEPFDPEVYWKALERLPDWYKQEFINKHSHKIK